MRPAKDTPIVRQTLVDCCTSLKASNEDRLLCPSISFVLSNSQRVLSGDLNSAESESTEALRTSCQPRSSQLSSATWWADLSSSSTSALVDFPLISPVSSPTFLTSSSTTPLSAFSTFKLTPQTPQKMYLPSFFFRGISWNSAWVCSKLFAGVTRGGPSTIMSLTTLEQCLLGIHTIADDMDRILKGVVHVSGMATTINLLRTSHEHVPIEQ